ETIPIRPRRTAAEPRRAPLRAVETPPPPAHLSEAAARLWTATVEGWELEAPDLAILQGALESWDAYQTCRAEVERDGPTFRTETGQIRAHPAAKLALDNLAAFRQAMRQLGLEPAA